jgi:pimeloyl-ACP methyl ester carboxylesterase
MSHTEGRFLSGEVAIAYRRFDGPTERTPLLIVHGLSFIAWDWIPHAEALSTDRPVVAMDMRGFGDSAWAADYSLPAMAGDVIALLDYLGWARAVLSGHSMGGRTCAYAAVENPERVAALVAVDWSPENAPAGNRRVSETVAGLPDRFETVEEAMAYFKCGPEKRARMEAYLKPVEGGFVVRRDVRFRDQFRRLLETGERPARGVDLWQVLDRLACPTLILRGARSDMFAPETRDRMLAVKPGLKLVELDTGHDVGGEDPEGYVREVRAFLDELGL